MLYILRITHLKYNLIMQYILRLAHLKYNMIMQYWLLGLCTGTWFIVIPVNRHLYQNRYGYPYSFDMFLTRNIRKMQEIYVFCGELCRKLLCWHVNSASARLRRHKIVTTCENSRGFLLRRRWGSHSRRHLLNKIKQCFYCN